jgi:hypothetical protein
MIRLIFAAVALTLCSTACAARTPEPADGPIILKEKAPAWMMGWSRVTDMAALAAQDDDVRRHSGDAGFFAGIVIDERRFSENGFDWHLLRFASEKNPFSVLWVVPHDDEDAAFEAMIGAIHKYGGTGIVVNSGPGSERRQAGRGTCGGRPRMVNSCDPNRNFADATPLFTAAHLDHHTHAGQPIIALHTNGAGADGDFSLLDLDAYRRGQSVVRNGGYAARSPAPEMANYDTLGLIAHLARDGGPSSTAVACRNALNDTGIHFWHEEVKESDGSLSNYLALKRPEIAYFNAESREETDLSRSAARHGVMIDAYLEKCVKSGF